MSENSNSELALLWVEIKAHFKEKFNLPDAVTRVWFDEAELTFLGGDEATVTVKTDFKKETIERHYMDKLSEAFEDIIGGKIKVNIRSSEQSSKDEKAMRNALAERGESTPIDIYARVGDSKIIDLASVPYAFREFTFDNFIEGESNRMAAAAAKAVASAPGSNFNPLFIHGPSGLGKTHLLYAITQEARKNFPNSSIVYVKGEDFTNQLIQSIATNRTEEFRARYRSCNMLLIDDIQFIAGKDSTQLEFFNTFNELFEDSRQIILASDRPPKDIARLEDRIRSRFESGLIVDINPPDFELRTAILRRKAEKMNMSLPDDVVIFVAENLTANVRQLEGAVKKLYAQAMLTGTEINVDTAITCISDHIVPAEPMKVTADKIVRAVCTEYGLSQDEIKGRMRSTRVAIPRHVACYLLKYLTDMSFPAIGKIFGRDHTTIISSVDWVTKHLESDAELEKRIEKIKGKVK